MKLKSLLTMLCVVLSAIAVNAEMYILGEVNGNTWNPTQGVAMTETSEKVYEVTATVNEYADRDGYFGFVTALGASADDWATVNSNRYGGTTGDYKLTPGVKAEIVKGENAYSAAGGEYKITVNLNDMTVLIEGDGGVVVTYPEKLYVCGHLEGTSWDPANTSAVLEPTSNEGEFAGFVTVVSCSELESDPNYGYGFIGFSSTVGTWAEFNANRLGAESADLYIALTETKNLVRGEYSFKLDAGPYYMVVDMKNMTFTIRDTLSGLKAVDASAHKVIGGEGRIAVAGEYKTVAIYGANGALLSKDNGDYACAKGLYIVVVDGKAEKVVVR